MLLGLWSDMPLSHRPDLAVYRNPVPIKEMSMSPFMWPYINLEDLCKTEPLLLMVQARARYWPGHFTFHDFKSVCLGYKTSYYTKVILLGYAMSFRDGNPATKYGQLFYNPKGHVKFEQDPAQGFWHPEAGFRVLAVQDRLYYFLVRFCEEVLHDIPAKDLLEGDLSCLDSPPVITSKFNSSTIRFLAIDVFEGFYKSQLGIQFKRVESLIGSMLFAAEDHLRSLREDPDYFRTILTQREEHFTGRLLDLSSEKHPSFIHKPKSYWGQLIGLVLSEAFSIFCVLEATHNAFHSLNSDFENWRADPSRTANLPSRISKTVYGLFFSMAAIGKDLMNRSHLLESIYSSPPLREYFYFTLEDPNNPKSIEFRRRPRVNMTEACADTVYLLEHIANKMDGIPVGYRYLLTELDLLIWRNPRVKSFISNWVGAQISILGVFCECFEALEGYQPWILGYMRYRDEYPGKTESFYQTQFGSAFNAYHVPTLFWNNASQMVRDLLIGETKYPVREPRSKEVVKKLRKTEEDFDRFWDKVVAQLKMVRIPEVCTNRVFRREPKRTAPWVEPAKRKRTEEGESTGLESKRAKATKEKTKNSEGTDILSRRIVGQVNENAKEIISMTEEADAKTKGFVAEDGKAVFTVDSRTFKVFNTLLFDGIDPSVPAEISWDDLVNAMITMGFTAEKLFGSAWLFQPMDPEQERDYILFHEPYETGKLDYVTTRHYGRRLGWVFRWKHCMFARAC
ncbi:hypothetical protein F4774DRAFT_391046 [Daldinia eschscholtzii]|nr:hypothetical protein F4774DRAFT_391046 [Daldinia eschscholtzii]